MFESYLLEHNHRQGKGGKWTETLNRIRIGKHTEDDINILRSRMTKEDFLNHDSEHVMYKNKTVASHNNKMLASLESEEIVLPAIKPKVKGHTYKINPDTDNIDDTNFKNKLKVKTGARVNLNFNIRTIDELVNGSSGKIIDFVKNRRGNVDAIIILFDQATTGELQRKKHKNLLCSKKHGTGTPILRHKLEYQGKSARGFGESCMVSVTQFPMTLSWASTSHKMQVRLTYSYVHLLFACIFTQYPNIYIGKDSQTWLKVGHSLGTWISRWHGLCDAWTVCKIRRYIHQRRS